jgi:cyclase
MNGKVLASAGLALGLFAASASAQLDPAKVRIQTRKLSETTYMMTGSGGNLAVSVGNDGVFIVDDQFAPLTPKINAAVTKLSKKPIRFVINTHWHFDHTGGNENFGKAGAVIVAHDNVRKRMSSEQMIEFLAMPIKASPAAALPVITFPGDVRFHLNGEEIHAFHVPDAHTDGDAIVHFRTSNVVHLGDVFFNKLYPFIDTSSGGSVDGMIAAVDKVLALADDKTQLVPGHGPLATKAELQAYRDMLSTVAERVRTLVGQGKTLEEVLAAKPTADFDAAWGQGFLPPAKFVEMLWKGLQK